MLAQKKPSKKKNIIMIVVLVVITGITLYVLFVDSQPASIDEGDIFNDFFDDNSLEKRNMNKVNTLLDSLDMNFLDYNIYKRLDPVISLPEISSQEVGNPTPFNKPINTSVEENGQQ